MTTANSSSDQDVSALVSATKSTQDSKPQHQKLTKEEWRNVIVYICGIMCFKFSLETLSSSVGIMAQEQFAKNVAVTFLAILTATFNLMQCLFAIAISTLMRRWQTKTLLSVAIWSFGALAALIVLINACTGGTVDKIGQWSIYLLFPIYGLMGGCLGAVELIRRVIPRDIVGESGEKLQKMDATVHIFYEIAGTSGAFFSAFYIQKLGPVYSLSLLPFFFTFAGIFWYFLNSKTMTGLIEDEKKRKLRHDGSSDSTRVEKDEPSAWQKLVQYFKDYLDSIKIGAILIFSSRRFSWLFLGYTLPLVLHRFIENVIFPTFAKNVLKNGAYTGILLGGSNFGELIGAAIVLVVSTRIKTPLPWVRFDALALSILWVFPYAGSWISPTFTALAVAWSLMPMMMFLSAGWAAGDVSLAAFIQTELNKLPRRARHYKHISPLGAVMAFLYSSYIVIFTIVAPLMGVCFDYFNVRGEIELAFFWVCGIGIAVVLASVIFGATFIPQGSWAWNPESVGLLSEEADDEEDDKEAGRSSGETNVEPEENVMEMVFIP